MQFFNLLIPKEKIVGMEINSQKLRMLYLELDRNGKAFVKGKSETDLEEGVIVSGMVKDSQKLSLAIKKLKENFKPKKFLSPFVIVTISQNGVYSDIIELPDNLTNEQLAEAISLNAAENLPLPLSQCYIDWQVIERKGIKNRVLAASLPKKIADDYINVLKENGFRLIALEASFLSIERAICIPRNPTILLYLTDEGITNVIYNNRFSYFSKFEFWFEASLGEQIKKAEDVNKIIKRKIKEATAFFESKYKLKIEKILLMSYGFDADIIIKKIGITDAPIQKAELKINSIDNSDWVPSGGAAARAFIPRSDDAVISLLPIGTESLYETQKTISFANSISLLISAIASLYLIIFTAAFIFISFIESNISKQIEFRNSIAMPQEYSRIESETKEFNDYIESFLAINPKSNMDYTKILDGINKLNTPGIYLANIKAAKPADPILVSGTASSRENLNVFKKNIEDSSYFKKTKFSIPNITQRSNISFSLTLYLK